MRPAAYKSDPRILALRGVAVQTEPEPPKPKMEPPSEEQARKWSKKQRIALDKNRPKKGDVIKVDPITDLADVAKIKELIRRNPKYLCIFTLGVNTNLRACDLLRITYGQVKDLKPMDELVLKEKKTGKERRISLNKACIEAIRNYISIRWHWKDEETLFGNWKTKYVHKLVKGWCESIGLKGNYGSHTMRKTWGYMQYHLFNVKLPHLMFCFNHSTERQTLDYLCLQPEDIQGVYSNEI